MVAPRSVLALALLAAGCAASGPEAAGGSEENEVNVGYGTVPGSRVTGAVSRVEPDRTEQTAAHSVEDLIVGRVPGVMRGPDGRLRIRGENSLNGSNEPLYVVDGTIVSSLLGVNPADVASIDVLKDNAATSVYGSRGSNGVILITTTVGDR